MLFLKLHLLHILHILHLYIRLPSISITGRKVVEKVERKWGIAKVVDDESNYSGVGRGTEVVEENRKKRSG